MIAEMLNLIKSSDFIGIKPGLVIDKSRRFTTYFGGVISLLVAVGLLLSALFFSQDLVFYKYPNETRSINYSTFPNEISVNHSDFIFLIKDENGKTLSPIYFDISLIEITKADCSHNNLNITEKNHLVLFDNTCTTGKNDNNFFNLNENYKYTIKKINFGNCLLNELTMNKFKLNSKNNTLCIQENDNTSLFGNENGYISRELYLSVFPCNPKLNSCPIDNKSYFEKNRNFEIRIMYENHIYNQKSYNDITYSYPDNTIVNQLEGRISRSSILLKNIEINTDIGYIFEDFRSEKVIIKSEKTFQIINFNYNIPHFLNGISESEMSLKTGIIIDIKISPFTELIFRKYTKIQRILAEVGGLFKFFMVCALIINYFQDKSSYYEKLFNELFSIDDLQKYFQYYEKDSKESLNNYRRIRNSIALKGIKQEEFIKKINKIMSEENISKEKVKKNKSFKGEDDEEHIGFIDNKTSPDKKVRK